MATPRDVILGQLATGQYLLDKFTSDLSDQEYFVVPTEGANHAAWIVGHIAVSEDSMSAAVAGGKKRLGEDLYKLFQGGTACVQDASKYPSRKAIDELFKNARAHCIEALKAFDVNRWDEKMPDSFSAQLFPTRGSYWNLIGTHHFWHIGQLTVCRVALRKKHVLM